MCDQCKILDDNCKKLEKLTGLNREVANITSTIVDDSVFDNILKVVMDALNSKFGLMSYINENGDAIVAAMTRDIFSECEIPRGGNKLVFPKHEWKGIWGDALINKHPIFSNDPDSMQVPDGHVKIEKAITCPIIFDDKVIGNFVLANKEEDYDDFDIKLLKSVSVHIAAFLNSKIQSDFFKGMAAKVERAIWDMINYANIFVVMLDEKMNIRMINWSLATKLGFENEREPLNACWLDFVPKKSKNLIKIVHSDIMEKEEVCAEYQEIANEIRTLEGEKIMVKWFNTFINDDHRWTFSIGITKSFEPMEISEESVRTYYRDIIMQDRTMLQAIKNTVLFSEEDDDKTCESDLIE